MNTPIIRTLAIVCLCAALTPVYLMAQGPMQVKIPFDFTVGSTSFAGGDYIVRPLANSVVAIQSSDSRSAIMTLTTGLVARTPLPNRKLVFHRYGDRYFLSQVWGYDSGRELRPSAAEKELIAKARQEKPVTLVATN
jgi:hypothetical protein